MEIMAALLITALGAPGYVVCMDPGSLQQNRQNTENYHVRDDREYDQKDHFEQQRNHEQHRITTDGFLIEAPRMAVSMDTIIGSDVLSHVENEDLGTLDDILLDRSGVPIAAIISIGGILGVGERNVALNWDKVEVRPERASNATWGSGFGDNESTYTPINPRTDLQGEGEDDATDLPQARARDGRQSPASYVVVVEVPGEKLEDAPEFDRHDW